MEGLRAGTAEHAAKQRTTSPERPSPRYRRRSRPTGQTPDPPVAEQPAGRRAPAGWRAPGDGSGRGELVARGMWARFVAGSLLIVVSMAAATAISLLLPDRPRRRPAAGWRRFATSSRWPTPATRRRSSSWAPTSARRARRSGPVRHHDAAAGRCGPDHGAVDPPRPEGQHPRPRDRQVQRRLHATAGPKLTVKVVKQLTGLTTSTTSSTSTSPASPTPSTRSAASTWTSTTTTTTRTRDWRPSEQYAEINIPAGYQRMCGLNALQYVRYRHDDNDLVRSARQQDFLREARQELPPES